MGQFSNDVYTFVRALVPRAAPAQAGLFSGDNPSNYNTSDPIRLWIIQVVIIICFTQLLGLLFARIRQPRVIAEIIGGVLLGPTVMGRIPGFRQAIFPEASMPILNLTSTIGLVLFLFLIGLEIDTRVIKRNFKASLVISAAGLVIPIGLGAALGVAIYHEFINSSVNFGYFILFTAVAVGITAFPVLCRILTELKLLDTTVGVVVISAGVGNDVVGWILLALTVALVNASNGLTALWVLLTGVGYVIFLLYPGRWTFLWLARRTGSLETGQPTAFMMTVTLLVVFISAFFTDVIGIHAIFGGFLAGLIIPQENGFAIALVEKLEDLVCILFLPLYFTYSGLRTNLGLLDNGITWGYTILICVVAFLSKFLACFGAAKFFGFNIRESGAIGALMSCKGLVELIVLNVGLQAGILDTRTFSMFVVHAIVLTFMTTPITLLVYPEKYRTHAGVHKEKLPGPSANEGTLSKRFSEDDIKTKFAVILDKIEQLPAAMTLTQLLQNPAVLSSASSGASAPFEEKQSANVTIATLPKTEATSPLSRITIDVLRLIELTDRTSAVFKSQAADYIIRTDPVVAIFRTFGYLNRLSVSTALNVVSYDEFSITIANHARESGSQLVIVPWCRGGGGTDEGTTTNALNPFDGIFHKPAGHDQTSSVVYSNFIRRVFMDSPTDVALFVDRGIPSGISLSDVSNQHLFLPFFGGPDDRLALSFVVQLCANHSVTATVVRVKKSASDELTPANTAEEIKGPAAPATSIHNTLTFADTVYGYGNTQTRLASETADSLLWDRYTISSSSHSPVIAAALRRIQFSYQSSPRPLHTILDIAAAEQQVSGRTLVVVVGRSRRLATESHQVELRQILCERGSAGGSDSVSRTLGDVGAVYVAAGTNASLLVLQACLA